MEGVQGDTPYKDKRNGYDPNNSSDAGEALEFEIYESTEFEAAESLKLPRHHGWNIEAAVKAATEELKTLADTAQDN